MKIKLNKKPVQLKLSSMSEYWTGHQPKKSGKHRSQEIIAAKRRLRKIKKKKGLYPLNKNS